jgi:hypothetical protein
VGFQAYGRREWVAEIKRIHRRGERIFAGDLQDKYPYLYNQGVWIFGDWDKALRTAGFQPETMRVRKFWDREKIIAQLRTMFRSSVSLSIDDDTLKQLLQINDEFGAAVQVAERKTRYRNFISTYSAGG